MDSPIPQQLGNLLTSQNSPSAAMNLTGSIPRQLGNLDQPGRTGPRWVTSWTGQIYPLTSGNLSNLSRDCTSGRTSLQGSDPHTTGRDLSNLKNLCGSEETSWRAEIPSQLGNLSDLEELEPQRITSSQGKSPQSFTGLTNLSRVLLLWGNAGLCVPTDSAFQAWLQGIRRSRRGRRTLLRLCRRPSRPRQTIQLHKRRELVRQFTNWLSDLPMGSWHGVNTDDQGRVTELYLPENQLSGTDSG